MDANDLLFVGFNSKVAALNRDTGELVWRWNCPKGMGYVTLLVDGDRLMASVGGYTYCLRMETGEAVWFNPLEGFGTGVPSLASVRGGSSTNQRAMDEMAQQQAANGATAGAAVHGGV